MNLDDTRAEIDRLDETILRLLNERAGHAAHVGQYKRQAGLPIYVPSREREVLDRLMRLNPGPMTGEMVQAVYREVMSAALAMEKPLAIAYLGPPSTFSHQAARSKFGASVDYLSCETIGDVFQAVGKKNADYGVVPVENSSEGGVTETLDSFLQTRQTVCAEIYMQVAHHLMSKGDMRTVRRIYSHPQALSQCRRWLQREMPSVEIVAVTSTARAAQMAEEEAHAGALAGSLAAEIHGLHILAADVQDEVENLTRFLVLGPLNTKPSGKDKTSIFFSVKHDVGALYGALRVFKQSGLNLTRIESRPSRSRVWEYFFFVDFEGHAADPPVKQALAEVEKHCTLLCVLGSYPCQKKQEMRS